MRPSFIVFLTILSAFLYLANLVVYEATATIFNIVSPTSLLLLALKLGILSASFIASTFLGMKYYNFFTRWYYRLSVIWIGFFVYLFLVSVLYGLVAGLLGSTAVTFGLICFAIAFLSGVYGLFHAGKIKIKEVNITLPNLPEVWKGRKIVWTSDLHLGQLHGSRFTKKVVDIINETPHDMVFIGGDLFDGTGAPDVHELVSPLMKLSPPLGTYFITGNHEEFGDNKKFLEAIRGVGIKILMNEVYTKDDLQIIGVDYKEAANKERFKKILSTLVIDKTKPSILLKHEPKDLDVAEERGISLQISGHTHRAQLWPLEYIARMTYKGFAYGLKNFKNMQVLISSGTGTWGPPMRVGTDSEILVISFN
jgi:predicted MPP superfamily phosphohydrolase